MSALESFILGMLPDVCFEIVLLYEGLGKLKAFLWFNDFNPIIYSNL